MKPSVEGMFKNGRNQTVHVRAWWSSFEPKAAVLAVHGLFDGSRRFSRMAENLTGRGFHLLTLDLPGFVRSDEAGRMTVRFDDLLDSVQRTVLYFREPEMENLPLFLLGYDTGAGVALLSCVHGTDAFRGLVLISPVFSLEAFGIEEPETGFLAMFRRIFKRRITLTHPDPGMLVKDPVFRKQIEEEKAERETQLPVTFLRELTSGLNRAREAAAQLRIPLLIQIGENDPFLAPQTVEALYAAVPGDDKEILRYEGMLHELHNEKDRSLVFDDLERWLLKHLH